MEIIHKILLATIIVTIVSILSFGAPTVASAHSGLNDPFTTTTHPSRATYMYGNVDVDCSTWTHSSAWIAAHPGQPTGLGGDTDNDSLCNEWEKSTGLEIDFQTTSTPPSGVPANHDFIYHYDCDPCPNPTAGDLYIELDWMRDPTNNSHAPSSGVIQAVKEAFAAAPTGITLHVQLGEVPSDTVRGGEITFHKDSIKVSSSLLIPPGFYRLKEYYFGTRADRENTSTSPYWSAWSPYPDSIKDRLTAKRQAFHYEMIIYKQSEAPTSSGWGEVRGNDFVVSLGSYTPSMGSLDQQEGTMMHELGHNLNLRHGGNEDTNCKPNYLSIMSYTFQFAANADTSRPLDFSRVKLNDINEAGGVLEQSPAVFPSYTYPTGGERKIFYSSPSGTMIQDNVNQAVNWNQNGVDGETIPYTQNINNLPSVGCADSTNTNLKGYNDWQNLVFNFLNTSYGLTGAGSDVADLSTSDEITYDDVRGFYNLKLVNMDKIIDNIDEKDFKNGKSDKSVLKEYISNAIISNQKDDLTSISENLSSLRGVADHSISNKLIKSEFLSLVDDKIKSFDIAQGTRK